MDWKNKSDVIINKIKHQLYARLYDDLESYYQIAPTFDTDNTGFLTQDIFIQMINKLGIYLTLQEIRQIQDLYMNQNRQIGYTNFFQDIRKNINNNRKQSVIDAFVFINEDSSQISLDNLFARYKPQVHHRVLFNQKSQQEVMDHFKMAMIKKSSDGVHITLEQFMEYYLDVNAVIPKEKEDFYSDLLIKTWGVTSGEEYVSPKRIKQLESIFYEKVRQHTKKQFDESLTLMQAFAYYDINVIGVTDFNEFVNSLQYFGCNFKKHEYSALFNQYNHTKTGKFFISGQINPKELAEQIKEAYSGHHQNPNLIWMLYQQPPSQLFLRVKEALRQNPKANLMSIFQQIDEKNTGFITRQSLKIAMQKLNLDFGHIEINKFARYFDKNCDDRINYSNFMQCLN